MECAAHPGTVAATACGVCAKTVCERCLEYDVNGRAACATCGRLEDDRSRALGSALIATVSAGYLAALALAYLVFRGRPFVGGLAAMIALIAGRLLYAYLRPPIVTRRSAG